MNFCSGNSNWVIVCFFDMRALHGNLNEITPKNDIHRYTLRMAKEGSKIEYRGDWAKEERAIMVANGYQNGMI